MLVLLGIGVVVLGFVLRANPLLVVMAAALTTGLAAAWTPEADFQIIYQAALTTLAAFGKAFNDNRYVSMVWFVLLAIGLLERAGLQERARMLIANVQAATVGRVLWVYFLIRQSASALGLTSLGGHPQMVRPLVAPMAEGAAEAKFGPLPDRERYLIRSHAAAADNIGLFFGEDIFIAIASILLIKSILEQNGIIVEPLQLSIWAIPTAIAALLIHSLRLWLLDAHLKRKLQAPKKAEAAR
ncbi:DUF969 domain-containing protein [Candidatus Viadribacter manganicus]|uniref:DUF969 domain-containing protein n=1 Tax=Candidatus Viadribacter manganicus TaxID=1759059 RepID=A0A1B1AJ19_9PROT|nr:DUF969 domain-containing protein [Candidatus Viadribacter manganicus]ANP46552.1 hypothetical protein ATE48_11800 [Candidatus Viadribacter manganicus]